MAREQGGRAGWIGIPSFPPERAAQAFVSFYLAITIAIVIDALLITHNGGPSEWQTVAEEIFDDGGAIVAWALAATWPIMEVFRMVLASIWEKRILRRGIEQGRREGLQEGRNENQRLWEEWNQRRLSAQERGEPFDETPPGAGLNGS